MKSFIFDHFQYKPLMAASAGLFLGLALVCLTPGSAAAQGTQDERAACQSDAFRLCSEFIPSADRVGACLKQKRRSLSPACRTVIGGGSKSVKKSKKSKKKKRG